MPAVYRSSKIDYIEYYCTDPSKDKLSRKQIKLNRIAKRFKSKRDYKVYVAEMVNDLNTKLRNGWSPFYHLEDARLYTPILDVFEIFLTEKKKDIRPDTLRVYSSIIRFLTKWILANNSKMYISAFTHNYAVRFLDNIYNTRNISQRTYNNYTKNARAIFAWCVEKCYIKENPFQDIKLKRNAPKKRIIVPADCRRKIIDYYKTNNTGMLLVCYLVYYSLIRPKEIRYLRIKDVFLDKHYIFISSNVAKNGHDRYSALTPDIIELLQTWNLERFKPDCFLIGSDFRPGSKQIGNTQFTKYWDRMRKDLKLSDAMQLYSLRDTGMIDMIESGINPLTVKQHADHHSLEMTTIYTNHADPNLIDKMYNQQTKF